LSNYAQLNLTTMCRNLGGGYQIYLMWGVATEVRYLVKQIYCQVVKIFEEKIKQSILKSSDVPSGVSLLFDWGENGYAARN
jgi:hypothetical protein